MHQYDLVLLPSNFHHSSYFEPTNSKSECQSHLLLCTVGASSTQGYASVLDYEAHMLVHSHYNKTRQGKVPINPVKLAGHYVLK